MSLRARLLLGMIVLVTIGLTAAAIATYEEQRSFLYDRLDQQVRAAAFPVFQVLHVSALDGATPFAHLPSARRAFPHRPQGRNQNFPAGTVGELITAGGKVTARSAGSFSQTKLKPLTLPGSYPVARAAGQEQMFTFTSGGVHYRAIAVTVPQGRVVVAVPTHEVDQTLNRLVIVELLVGAGVLAALFIVGWFVIRVGLRPLERIRDAATEIAHGDLSRRVTPATGRTEVGRLGLSLNDMLEQIEQAFRDRSASEDRLRQFLADASHELRTPLAAVRGYAELYRIGAARDDEAVARSMARIEAEAARMGGLVEDLLALARLDQLPEAQQRPVDVSEVVAHAADDARAIGPSHEIRYEAGAACWAQADVDQLRQVLANLVRNAVIHTPTGTPIDLSVAAAGEQVRIEVRDHGPGLPEGAGDEVFERFWRSEGGRSRGPGGAGLGLAIVKAIVEAHHGEVHADNAPGGGARFRVILPAAEPRSVNAQDPPTFSVGGSATFGG